MLHQQRLPTSARATPAVHSSQSHFCRPPAHKTANAAQALRPLPFSPEGLTPPSRYREPSLRRRARSTGTKPSSVWLLGGRGSTGGIKGESRIRGRTARRVGSKERGGGGFHFFRVCGLSKMRVTFSLLRCRNTWGLPCVHPTETKHSTTVAAMSAALALLGRSKRLPTEVEDSVVYLINDARRTRQRAACHGWCSGPAFEPESTTLKNNTIGLVPDFISPATGENPHEMDRRLDTHQTKNLTGS